MVNSLLPPVLTRRRIWLACGVAVVVDFLQLVVTPLGPPAWMLDEILDAFTMVVQSFVLGFHPLLLPTFIVKSIPMVNALPTWTGCTLILIGLRRKQQVPAPAAPQPPPRPVSQEVIDI